MQELISRKDFLSSFFSYIRKGIAENPLISTNNFSGCILPPGALPLAEYTDICTQCYRCVSVCPFEALRVYHGSSGHVLYGYPVINPRLQACLLCNDYPCIAACTDGALIKNFDKPRLGTASINTEKCLAYYDHFCQTCISACPSDGKAIRLNNECRPEIDIVQCSGCGICVQSCPIDPPAIEIHPVHRLGN